MSKSITLALCILLSANVCAGEDVFVAKRQRMVQSQIRDRGISDGKVLEAMMKVERHFFVPGALRRLAYEDTALPIGYGQTISQPYIVAYMTVIWRRCPT